MAAGVCYVWRMDEQTLNPRSLDFPTRLCKALKAAKLSPRAAALKAGFSPRFVGLIIAQQSVTTIESIARLANVLGVSASWLGYGMGPRPCETTESSEGMGKRLHAMRTAQGLSLNELARRSGKHQESISAIEQGGQTRADTLEALARELSCSPAWLAFGTEPKFLPERRGRPPRSAAQAETGT